MISTREQALALSISPTIPFPAPPYTLRYFSDTPLSQDSTVIRKYRINHTRTMGAENTRVYTTPERPGLEIWYCCKRKGSKADCGRNHYNTPVDHVVHRCICGHQRCARCGSLKLKESDWWECFECGALNLRPLQQVCCLVCRSQKNLVRRITQRVAVHCSLASKGKDK